jgi:uncharacterized protein YjbJ (UPF0337 family)
MPNKTLSRIFAGLSLFLCAIVLLISLAGIVGTWVAGRALTDASLVLLDGIDRSAETAHQAIGRVNTGLAEVTGEVSSLEAATTQLSQNVNDKGLVLTLLPQGREDALSAKVQQFVEEFNNVREVVVGAIDLYRAVDALPFVNLPKPESERMQTVANLASEIASTVKDLNARITEVRSNAAGAIAKVTDALGNAKDRLAKIATELNTLDAQLLAVQARAAQLKQTIPVAITVAMIVLTLFMAWVAYTQIVVMRGAWRKLRAPGVSSDGTLPSAEVSG